MRHHCGPGQRQSCLMSEVNITVVSELAPWSVLGGGGVHLSRWVQRTCELMGRWIESTSMDGLVFYILVGWMEPVWG